MTEPIDYEQILEVSPASHEVAVARIPAGVTTRAPGRRDLPAADWDRYAAVPGADLGWGAKWNTWVLPLGVALYKKPRDRKWWQKAAQMLAADGELVLYVVHELTEVRGKPVWVAVKIRTGEE